MLEKMVLLKTSSVYFKDQRVWSEGRSKIESFDFFEQKKKKTTTKKTQQNQTTPSSCSYKAEADSL